MDELNYSEFDLIDSEIEREKVYTYLITDCISIIFNPIDNIWYAEHIDDNLFDNIIILEEDNQIQFLSDTNLFDEHFLSKDEFWNIKKQILKVLDDDKD